MAIKFEVKDNNRIPLRVHDRDNLSFAPSYPKIYTGETEMTPTEGTQSLPVKGMVMMNDVTVNPIPSQYIVPQGTKAITDNGAGIDVTNYASVDVFVSPSLESTTKTYTPTESIQTETISPSTGYDGLSSVGITVNAIPSTYGKKYEWVKQLYTTSINLSTGTSYDTWTASTTAGSILATTSLSSNTFVADMANYEYLLWWKMWIQLAYNSGATLKAMPIWEGMDAIQSVFRRPSSLTEIASSTKGGNACATQTTAPLLKYYDTNGAVKYTWSNSNGIYGTVQAATFSSSTSLTPTVTPKRPIIYAKCSSSYFATGRKTQVDSANCTFYITCDLYRQPTDVYGQTKAYEGIVSTYNSSQS